MDTSSDSQIILNKVYEFYRLTMSDSDDKIKNSIQEILYLWPEVVAAGDKATDDELFILNVSRAVLTQVFTIVLSKEFFNKDYLLVRKIFFTCFNILINHLNIFKNNNSIYIDSNIRLIMKMTTSITSLVQFQNGDLSKIRDNELLIAMREHIDQDSKHDNLTDGIISLIWNLSDRTILVPILLNAGYANSVVQWIKNRENKFRDDKIDAPIHILHNISRHDDGIDRLNTHDALKVIEEIKIESNIYDDADDMTIHIAMIRALLTDINQIKFDSMKYSNKVVNMLVQLSIDAAQNERYHYNGSHVSEPLTVLVKLFYNDEILNNILSNNVPKSSLNIQSIIELFASLLGKFYPKINLDNDLLENYTCVVILNLFWLISNHEKYRQIIHDHQQLMDIVKNAVNDDHDYTDTFMPRTMKSIKQAANDILKNLKNKN
jgi:hypothetical protein